MTVQYHIICNGIEHPIKSKTITWIDDPGFRLSPECFKKSKIERKPKLFVNHWDGCMSSKHCVSILQTRQLSVHFCIDSDGTIYQLMDTNDIAWHAKPMNTNSIGVEICNPVYLEYQSSMEKMHKPRPLMTGAIVHGIAKSPFLWFNPEQIDSLKELWKVIHQVYAIPFVCPVDENGLTSTTTCDKIDEFSGFISHYHITKDKWDCAGLDLKELLEKLI